MSGGNGTWAHGLRYRELPPPCLPCQQSPSIHPKQKKVYIPFIFSHVAHFDIHNLITWFYIDLHLPIPITYLAGYPPAHTPSGESLTDLIHRVTSGLIINILPYPCRPFHPPPLDLNDHRALYWNRPLFASFITETARIVSIHPGSAHPPALPPCDLDCGFDQPPGRTSNAVLDHRRRCDHLSFVSPGLSSSSHSTSKSSPPRPLDFEPARVTGKTNTLHRNQHISLVYV